MVQGFRVDAVNASSFREFRKKSIGVLSYEKLCKRERHFSGNELLSLLGCALYSGRYSVGQFSSRPATLLLHALGFWPLQFAGATLKRQVGSFRFRKRKIQNEILMHLNIIRYHCWCNDKCQKHIFLSCLMYHRINAYGVFALTIITL